MILFQTPQWKRLRDLIDERCLITAATLTLSTGTQSSFYFDCKKATLDGECLSLIADAFLEEIAKLPSPPTAIGGLTMGADFITAAVTLRAFQAGLPTVKGSIVRKEPKKHGTRNHIENELPAGTRIVLIDDVITTGNSTKLAGEKLLEEGYEVVGIIALIDREAGGAESLAERFRVPVRAIFKKSHFPRINEHPRTDEKLVVNA
ncbi:MAG: phosphoribosyltransferase family protein [Candidatus Competibacteraceae bacterium]